MGLNDKKKSGFELSKDQKKMLPAVLIPLAVIVLIMFIVLSDKKQAEPLCTVGNGGGERGRRSRHGRSGRGF
ncbi:MAG: hypothetical protein V8S27_09820 [Lachnospiraceae bacterium]